VGVHYGFGFLKCDYAPLRLDGVRPRRAAGRKSNEIASSKAKVVCFRLLGLKQKFHDTLPIACLSAAKIPLWRDCRDSVLRMTEGGNMLFRKIVRVALLVLMAVPVTASYGADVAKIGIVDFQRILENSTAGKEVKAELTQKGMAMEGDLKEKGGEIKSLQEKMERESLVMSKEMREEKEREIRIKINDIKSLQKKYENDLKEIQQRLLNRIKKEVFEIIQDVGKKEGYLLILENIGVIYSPNTLDITDKIIESYNARYAAKTPGGQTKSE
jgi:outer membrane protein